MHEDNREAVNHFSSTVRQFDAYYRDRPDFEERLPVWHRLLDKYARPGGTAIDMGCGTGIFSFYLAKICKDVVGIDGSPDMIAFCNKRAAEEGVNNVRFAQGLLPDLDVSGLPRPDLLISSSVVEYVGELDKSFELFARLLPSGGSLVLSMPNVFSVSRNLERIVHKTTGRRPIYRHIKHFSSPRLLATRLRRHGLTMEEAYYYAHPTRVARWGRSVKVPPVFTADLFVAAFRKR
jgi:SAM-dependent methyltransferase